VRVLDLVRRLEQDGVREILYTDISRDGMMESIDWKGVRELAESTSMQIIASGGVTNLDDLRALRELEPLGVTGVIVGRALYEKRFTVAEALAVLEAAPGCGAERGVQPEGVDAS
jgi:phosphoribosylformimino-5-aminoimidazole carboxamide ribotide isomerase